MGNAAQVSANEVPAVDVVHKAATSTSSSSRCVQATVETAHRCFQLEPEGGRRPALELQLPTSRPTSVPPPAGPLCQQQGVAQADKTRYYREWDSLRAALTGGDTRLVRGTFVDSMYKNNLLLPPWQDLPLNSYWDAEELLSQGTTLDRPPPRIISISYSWLSPSHPDPNGYHLHCLASLLRLFSRSHGIGLNRVAVFIDWCSLPQPPWGDLTRKAHVRAMRGLDIWYAHRKIDVWLLSSTPEGVRPFAERGWPTFEREAALILSGKRGGVLDIGQLSDPGEAASWGEVVEKCAITRRSPPLLPVAFEQKLNTKVFSVREDRQIVANKYWGVFHRALGTAKVLSYRGSGWGDEEIETLAASLPRCADLRELDLSENRITSAGAIVLAQALPHCQALRHLDLSNNYIGQEGINELEVGWQMSVFERNPHELLLDEQLLVGKVSEPVPLASDAGSFSPVTAPSPSTSEGAGPLLLARQAAFEARLEEAVAVAQGSPPKASPKQLPMGQPTTGDCSCPAKASRRDLETLILADSPRSTGGGANSDLTVEELKVLTADLPSWPSRSYPSPLQSSAAASTPVRAADLLQQQHHQHQQDQHPSSCSSSAWKAQAQVPRRALETRDRRQGQYQDDDEEEHQQQPLRPRNRSSSSDLPPPPCDEEEEEEEEEEEVAVAAPAPAALSVVQMPATRMPSPPRIVPPLHQSTFSGRGGCCRQVKLVKQSSSV